jgi:quercetin dioxygenase-like cupin family protein
MGWKIGMPERSAGNQGIVRVNLSSWRLAGPVPIGELLSRRLIRTPSVTILRVDFKKGAEIARHQHIHEQVTWLESGRLRLEIDQEEIILETGDVLRIPSNAPHFTEALEDSSSIEIFTPAREDLPSTDSTFLGGSANSKA